MCKYKSQKNNHTKRIRLHTLHQSCNAMIIPENAYYHEADFINNAANDEINFQFHLTIEVVKIIE